MCRELWKKRNFYRVRSRIEALAARTHSNYSQHVFYISCNSYCSSIAVILQIDLGPTSSRSQHEASSLLPHKAILVRQHTPRHLQLLIRLHNQSLVPRAFRTDICDDILHSRTVLLVIDSKA
jgi:hypothetical protein